MYVILSIILAILLAIGINSIINGKKTKNLDENGEEQKTTMLTLFVQDKKVAATSDCRVTQKITKEIPFTIAPINASLKILFEDELKDYAVYESVVVSQGVARIYLKSNNLPKGSPISALSSCQIGHLTSVLNDTLTQYDIVNKIELYSPEGKIEF